MAEAETRRHMVAVGVLGVPLQVLLATAVGLLLAGSPVLSVHCLLETPLYPHGKPIFAGSVECLTHIIVRDQGYVGVCSKV